MNDLDKHTSLNQAKFDAWAPTYEQKRFDFFRRMQGRVLSLLELGSGAVLLDIGCGTGWAVRQAASMIGESGAAYGIDLSAGMIEKAKEAAQGIRNASFTLANAEQLPFKDAFFSHVICTMSFHHYLHPQKVTAEISRVLNPQGAVCIVDATADSRIIRWVDGYTRRRQPDHVKMYSTPEFQELFTKSGLEPTISRRIFFLWFPIKAHFAKKPPA